jgi:hypothetical protein
MQRRQFVKGLFIFTSAGIASAYAKPFAKLFPRKAAKSFTGKITSKGKPLGNVIVTDSYSVVATDKNGMYAIDAHNEAQFITISTPSGYEFLHEDHISRQYKIMADVKDNNKVDFELSPLSKNDNDHQFVIWADPQVKNAKDVSMMMNESVPDLQKTLGALPAGTLIHGICVGDIVWDNHDLFPDYNKAIKKCRIPFFQAKGNHDMDYRLGGNETSDITFKKQYGPTHYSFNRGKVHYVVLDDVYYLGTEREYEGRITQQQLDWLQKDLSFVPKDNLLIVCLHIPVHNSVKNNKELYALLQPFEKCHIMSGHTHYNRNVIGNGVFEHNHGTVCGAWWTGPICEDGTPDGYGVYEVKGTDLSWHYKSTGKDKDHQLSLFIQQNEAGETEMVTNVYNWDPEWKIEWWLDDVAQGELKNKTGFDPLAVATMKGPNLPAARAFAEPKKTDHLFSHTLPSGYKKIKVRAMDRFGNSYEATA